MVRPRKAEDNEVTDREQYGTLVQSRLKRGRNLHILLNQRGRRKNPQQSTKFKFSRTLLLNFICVLLLAESLSILRFGKAYVDQVQRHILAGSRLQASDDRNKLRAHGEKIERRGGWGCALPKKCRPPACGESLCRMFSETSNESTVFFMFHLVQCEWGGGGCHVVGAPPDMHCACAAPPIALFTPIFAQPCDRSEVIHQILGDLHIIWSHCHTHRSHRSDFVAAAQFEIDTELMTDRPVKLLTSKSSAW